VQSLSLVVCLPALTAVLQRINQKGRWTSNRLDTREIYFAAESLPVGHKGPPEQLPSRSTSSRDNP